VLAFGFTDDEYARRRQAALALASSVGATRVLAFGAHRSGICVTYLTGWPVTRSAVYLLSDTTSMMWIQFHNHLSAARRTAVATTVVDGCGDMYESILTERREVVATLGSVPPQLVLRAQQLDVHLVPLDSRHAALRCLKSEQELEALALGAAASDIGAEALIDACHAGATDWDLMAAARSAYTRAGARDHICYICVTNMASPDRDVPSQFPEGRVLEVGSVVTFELSAAVAAEYPGQVLRTITLGEPTQEYMVLHDLAEQARNAIRAVIRDGVSAGALVDASACIEAAGMTTTDDLFHGLGMGYLEPIGTSTSRVPAHRPTATLSAGMTLVVQPNVARPDHRAGVQTGEMIVVTREGLRDIHTLPSGLVVK
jgi:Xaa-Pro dipeptidase